MFPIEEAGRQPASFNAHCPKKVKQIRFLLRLNYAQKKGHLMARSYILT
jgi:hypothetical protein